MTQTIDADVMVLDVLVATCQQTRRLNPSADVARAVLNWEARFVAARDKRQAALAAAAPAAAAPVDALAEGAGREASLSA